MRNVKGQAEKSDFYVVVPKNTKQKCPKNQNETAEKHKAVLNGRYIDNKRLTI